MSGVVVFEDLFPTMLENLGAEGFVRELCKGFRVLVDEEKGGAMMITFESLKKKMGVLGLGDNMSDDEVLSMLKEGDLDGDGCLDFMEFCVLMFRLSPHFKNISSILFCD